MNLVSFCESLFRSKKIKITPEKCLTNKFCRQKTFLQTSGVNARPKLAAAQMF